MTSTFATALLRLFTSLASDADAICTDRKSGMLAIRRRTVCALFWAVRRNDEFNEELESRLSRGVQQGRWSGKAERNF
jgi:hypothetical protein